MKYLSVCSGIEAATVAWHGLGWTPVAFAEIEAFPAAVLSRHYPTVPNLGDLTKYREWPEEILAEVDLLVGGTPCQAFSVAGLRRSLDDERGNLSLTYVNLFHHINEVRKRHGRSPAIALWENVPGVLSTKDNAFGCFIGGLLGCDEAPQTESGKWDKAGFLSSETVRVGYRVLDAQYFGVAQRRRRVFLAAVPCELVERFGERACPSEILSLRESVLGNPPSRGAAWQGAARDAAARPASGGECGEPFYLDRASFNQGENAQYEPQITNDGVAGSAVARGPAAVLWSASDQSNAERLVDQAGTLNCNKGQRGGWIAGHPDPAYALPAGNQGKGGVFGSGRDSQDTFVFTGDGVIADPIGASEARTYTHEGTTFRLHNCVGVCATGEKTHALTTRRAAEEDGTGRGTPIVPAVAFSAKDSGGDASNEVAPTMRAMHHVDGNANAGGQLAVAVRTANTGANGHGVSDEVTHTIDQAQGQAIAFKPSHFTRGKDGAPSEVVAPLSADADKGDQDTVVAIDLQNVAIGGDIAGTLDTTRPSRGGGQAVAIGFKQGANQSGACGGLTEEREPPLTCGQDHNLVAFTKSKRAQSNQDDESWVPGDVAPTQNQFDTGDTRATTVVAYNIHTSVANKGASETDWHTALRSRTPGQSENSTTTVVAFAQNQLGEVRVNADVMGTVNQNQNASGRNTPMVFASRTRDGIKVPEVMKDGVVPALTNPGNGGRADAVNVASAMQVRRLTPTECEALQGFPAGYTDVTFRKKPAADGPRYRALGNSMAVPCMWWLGDRIHKATPKDIA